MKLKRSQRPVWFSIIAAWLVLTTLIQPKPAEAVMPPDFIFNIGAQVAQFFSIILAVFSIALGTVIQFFRKRLTVMHSKLLWVGLGFLLLIGGVVAGILYQFNNDYYYDRLLVHYQDQAGADHALLIELRRYSLLPYYYQHEYTIKSFAAAGTEHTETVFNTMSPNIVAHDFLTSFSDDNHYNLQDEDYRLAVEFDHQQYLINLPNLTGDGLVNNALERFTYVNMGNTEVSIDGQSYSAAFALTKNLSIDVDKATLSEGTKGTSNSIFLTDQQGRFYLIDSTNVTAGATEYDSHNWTLYKQGKVVQKIIDADPLTITRSDRSLGGKSLTIDHPELAASQMNLSSISNLHNQHKAYDLVVGTIIDDAGERPVMGLSSYYDF